MTDMTAAPPAAAPAPAPEQGEGSEITVCIEFNPTTGAYSVGLEPPEAPDATGSEGADAGADADSEANEDSWMKPAKDINDAFRQAKALLEQPQSADGGPSPFEQAFNNVRGGPDMGATAGGLGQ